MSVEQLGDDAQLAGVTEIEPVFTQAVLSFLGFAHSGWPLFLGKLFGIRGLATTILYNLAGKRQPECALKLFSFFYLQLQDRN
jgi:hypothetical protein